MGLSPEMEEGKFGRSFRIAVPFLTKTDALTALLPSQFKLANGPMVIVMFNHCEKVEFLGGSELNVMGIYVPVVFEGEEDRLTGNYTPVIWENKTMAIVMGREIMGSPKLYGDMENPIFVNNAWHGLLSDGGRPLIDVKVGNLKPAPEENLAMMRDMGKNGAWMGWKHIPKETGAEFEISHFTHYPAISTVDKAWMGEGSITFHPTDPDLNFWNHQVMEKLRSLPIVEYLPAFVSDGSAQLKISEGRQIK